MNLFRTVKRADPPSDYGQLAQQIRDRRKTQRREPGQFPSFAEADAKQVRTYRPSDRLDSINEHTRQLVKDTDDIPRKWDCDWKDIAPHDSHPWVVCTVILAINLLGSSVLAAVSLSAWGDRTLEQSLAVGGIALAVSLGATSWCVREKFPEIARPGFYIAGAESAFFLALLVAAVIA